MSLVALFLLASVVSPKTQAAVVPCERPLQQIQLKMKVAEENLAVADRPALPGMWPEPVKTVECVSDKCKVHYSNAVKLSYEPYSFYADHLGLVGYPDVNPTEESIKIATLEWAYNLQKNACTR